MKTLNRFYAPGILYVLSILLLSACGGGGGGGGGTTAPPGPTLNSVNPTFGIASTQITVVGEHFGNTQGTSEIRVGAGVALVSSWSDTQIVATVSTDSFPGPREVQVEVEANIGGGIDFDVQLPPALYVNNDQAINTVSAYSINPTTGAVTAISGSPWATGSLGPEFRGAPYLLAIHEGTRRLFVTNRDGVAVFDIDPISGTLAAVSGSPFATNATTFGLAIAPDGNTLYAAAFNIDSIVIMDIAANGALSEASTSPVTAADQVDIPLVTPDGSFLYANTENGEFAGFEINSDGSLTALSGSPFLVDAGGFAKSALLSRGGDYLYIGDFTLDAIYSYALDGSTGMPVLTTNAPQASTQPGSMVFTPDGNRLFTSSETTVDCFTTMAGGDLSAATQIDLSGDGMNGISGMGFTANGAYLYVIDEIGGDINVYSVGAGCNASTTLTQATPPLTNADSAFGAGGSGMSGPVITRF